MADRPTGAYYLGRSDARLSHFVKRQRGDRFFGLGEKTGALDRAGRRFRMDCTDAMGYDAEHSDPLYKFWPFYIAKPSCAANARIAPAADSCASEPSFPSSSATSGAIAPACAMADCVAS